MILQDIVKDNVYEISIHVHQRNGKYSFGFSIGVEEGGKKEIKSVFHLPTQEALETNIAAVLYPTIRMVEDDDDFL